MKIGIIGGSGLYDIDGLVITEEKTIDTPFGAPSDAFRCGHIGDIEVVFLARHGRTHSIAPMELNHRANIYAMKMLGVTRIISLSAVGSFKAELAPLDFVVVDQYVDKTKQGASHTFFGEGAVAHVSLGHPVCECAREVLYETAESVLSKSDLIGAEDRCPKAYNGGTYVNMEGPAFSTKAESLLHKSWGMDLIGMTNVGEARLAREAEICYNTVAMVTDYDCWHEGHDAVTVDMVIGNLMNNAGNAKGFIKEIVGRLPETCTSGCTDALATALITPKDHIPEKTAKKLDAIIGRYL